MNLIKELRKVLEPAVRAAVPADIDISQYLGLIKPTSNPAHGDFQATLAMPLAKLLNKKPVEVANQIVAHLQPTELLAETPKVAGPGFINLTLSDNWLS